jgi:hypothetical protein
MIETIGVFGRPSLLERHHALPPATAEVNSL